MINIYNCDITIFHDGEAFTTHYCDKAWGEFAISTLKAKYGSESNYKGLIVIDGAKFRDLDAEIPGGLKTDDKVLPIHFDGSIEYYLELRPCEMFAVADITKHSLRDKLLTVEIILR